MARLRAGALALLAALAPGAASAGYCYTTIANSRATFSNVTQGSFALSDAGEVSFKGYLQEGGEGVFRGSGGPVTEIARSGEQFLAFGDKTDVDATGRVAFKAFGSAGGSGVYVGDGGPLVPILEVPDATYSGVRFFVSLGSGGIAAFDATIASGGEAIVAGDGSSAPAALYTSGAPFSSVLRPDVNATGTVAFCTNLLGGGQAIVRGNGGPLTWIADTTGGSFVSFSIESCASQNDAGLVAFQAGLPGGGSGIYLGDGLGPPTPVVDTAGPYAAVDGPSLNAAEEVAFFAELDAGDEGIFVGPDPSADAVVRSGYGLDGSTVTQLRFGRDGLNDVAQVAFFASLADGTRGFYLATPGPGCAPVLPACSDGLDNDGDLAADHPSDPGCATPGSGREDPQCNDGTDNDGDHRIDFGDDPDCATASGGSERAKKSCGLGAELGLLALGLRALRPGRREPKFPRA